jgi:hypothetical protein
MDFTFTADQESIRKLAAKALAGERKSAEALFGEAQRAGLFGLPVPAEQGGAGLGFLELCLALVEEGRAAAPLDLAPALIGALGVAYLGTADQKERLLPAAAGGEGVITLALDETATDPAHPMARAERDGDGWKLYGEKLVVAHADRAARAIVPARLGHGIGLFLLDPRAPGVKREAQLATDERPRAQLVLGEARVEERDLLAPPSRGLQALAWLSERLAVALCAVELGIAETQLRMTAEHAVRRQQFGKPIGLFQAVAQRAADAYIDVEALRLVTWQAAWRLHEGEPAEREVHAAAFFAADAGARVALAAQHLHGGIGFDRAYPLYRYFLAAKHIELTLGGANRRLAELGALLAKEPQP